MALRDPLAYAGGDPDSSIYTFAWFFNDQRHAKKCSAADRAGRTQEFLEIVPASSSFRWGRLLYAQSPRQRYYPYPTPADTDLKYQP